MPDPLRPGDPRELGGYRLLGRLGEGGMGAVFLGRSADGRMVAVKAIRPELANEPEYRGRFRSEVSRARQVPPFCTAAVLDADPEHTTPYLVVEYVDGPSLGEVVVDRGPLTGGDLHSVAIGVATALTAIHGAGVIHRDLKPRNVLFALGAPKVIDFGIAQPFEATSHHTRTNQMVGTLAYMAPERFDLDGPGIGPAADVFAWGAVVTYAGTGRTPFAADSAAATAGRILTQPPELGALQSPLREIVARTLAKDPADRPTAPELLELLLDTGSHSVADLTGRPELAQAARAARATVRRGKRRGRLIAAVVAGVLAVAALGAAGAWAASGRSTPVAAPSPSSSPSAPPPLLGNGPVIIDRLDRPGQWPASKDDDGACTYTGGRLVISGVEPVWHACDGPDDMFAGDSSIAATVALLEPGSCAFVAFRLTSDDEYNGYVLRLCADRIGFERHADDRAEDIGTTPTTALAGGEHRVEMVIRDEVATVSVDGTTVGSAPVDDRRAVTGWFRLGLESEGDATSGSVAYRDLEIRTL
ncbi:serine/threonine protein kinase [Catenuloplanes japonicus]|uniref:serine/threonine protein kinase n=1 Tax=Catenuloplanes japonicus TaxID=33876 RepID=UPI000525FA02|nr:serine/threonine-protein kinase [Catenuloplanes japonicus]